jgi:hypothetical protein
MAPSLPYLYYCKVTERECGIMWDNKGYNVTPLKEIPHVFHIFSTGYPQGNS